MPSIDDVFGGTTLRAADIQGKSPTVTIEDVQPKEFTEKDGKKKTKLLITFAKAKKALVCNSTNAHIIAGLYGNDYTTWPGQQIKLVVAMTPMGPGISVRDPVDKVESGPRKSAKEEMSDDIPF